MNAHPDLMLTNVRLPSGEGPINILISEGRIAQIGADLQAPAALVEDCGGQVLLGSFTDAHCHVDKTIWGSGRWLSHESSRVLEDQIAWNAKVRASWGIPNADYTLNLMTHMVANGTTRIRTHVDVDPELGLRAIEMVVACARTLAKCLDVEIVAFPQQGAVGRPDVLQLMEASLAEGASVVGGIDPAGIEKDPKTALDLIFGMAERTGAKVDIHVHDPGSLGAWQIGLVCERAAALGMSGRVTVSHAFALGQVSELEQRSLARQLAVAGVSIATAVPFNSPVLPLRLLTTEGVTVAFGNDSIRNTWSPFGTADMLQRVLIAATRYECRSDQDLRWILSLASEGGARLMGQAIPEVVEGTIADLVLVPALNDCDAVVSTPVRSLVIKRGAIVARDGSIDSSMEISQ